MSVPKKEVDFLAHPPPRALALVVALRFVAGLQGGERATPRPNSTVMFTALVLLTSGHIPIGPWARK